MAKPGHSFLFSVTVRKSDSTILFRGTVWAAGEGDAEVAVMEDHKDIPLLDDDFSVTVERLHG
jgi:hypothetical protein